MVLLTMMFYTVTEIPSCTLIILARHDNLNCLCDTIRRLLDDSFLFCFPKMESELVFLTIWAWLYAYMYICM